MTMFIAANPVATPIQVPIRQLIREERMRIEDAEWNGEEPKKIWINFLLSEQSRGVTMYTIGMEMKR